MKDKDSTKHRIAFALEELTSRKALSKITVAEIMRHCNMSRQTFYLHFIDIDEVVFWIYEQHANQSVQNFWQDKDFTKSIYNTAIEIKKHETFYKSAINIEGPNSFRNQFHNAMINYSYEHIGPKNITEKLHFLIILYWHGATESLIQWINNDMIVSPEKLANYIHSGLPNELLTYYP